MAIDKSVISAFEHLEVDEDSTDERLDIWLARRTGLARTQVQRAVDEGFVTYLGPRRFTGIKVSTRLRAGDMFEMQTMPVEICEVEPEDVPLDIIHEDSDLLVLVKPRGMVVHPAAGINKGTLVNALVGHCHDLSGIGGVGRPGIVHRLDKDTSGVMVVAKNDAAHSFLSRQFAGRVVKKEYMALVHGIPSPTSVIDMPIGRHPMDRKRMAVVFSGRPAVTEYERIEIMGDYSLLRVRLRTGRTHQIRVHLAWLGHPVAGDPVYCRRDPLGLSGQFLHAARLGFTHPSTGVFVEFEASPPADLQACLDRLRAGGVGDEPGTPRYDVQPRLDHSLRVLDGWTDAASGVR